jgi:hypothetical protein
MNIRWRRLFDVAVLHVLSLGLASFAFDTLVRAMGDWSSYSELLLAPIMALWLLPLAALPVVAVVAVVQAIRRQWIAAAVGAVVIASTLLFMPLLTPNAHVSGSASYWQGVAVTGQDLLACFDKGCARRR